MVRKQWERHPSFTLYYSAPQDRRSFLLMLRYGSEDRLEFRGTIGTPGLQIGRKNT